MSKEKFIQERLKNERSESLMFEKILVLQAENKRLRETLEEIIKYSAKVDTIQWFDYDNIEALAKQALGE